MRTTATLLCTLLVLTAGCSGFLGQTTETPDAQQETATPSTETATPVTTERSPSMETPTPEPVATSTPTETATPTAEQPAAPDNPWETRTVQVTFHDGTNSSRNFEPAVRSALEYWNGRADRYSEYNVTFSYRPDLSASEADMSIVASDPIEYCGGPVDHNYTTAGCYRHEHRVDIYDNQTDLQFRNTVVHEIGHALSLGHTDEPSWAMSTAGVELEGSITNASERENPWNTTGPLKVAVGASLEDSDSYEREVREVVEYYNSNDRYLPEGMEMKVVDEPYEAHIVAHDGSETSYSFSGPGSIGFWNGLEYDSDDRFEQYEVSHVYLNDIQPRNSERHIGYWVGLSLVASPEELPNRYG